MSQKVTLRLAKLTDAKAIAIISRDLIEIGLGWSWVPERVVRQIRCPNTVVLTAHAQEHLIGFAIMRFLTEEAHLNLLGVKCAYQRFGIGRRLVQWLEESAQVAGTFTVYLEVRANNRVARTFYRTLGYREVALVPRYYCGREAAIRMAHDLRVVH